MQQSSAAEVRPVPILGTPIPFATNLPPPLRPPISANSLELKATEGQARDPQRGLILAQAHFLNLKAPAP